MRGSHLQVTALRYLEKIIHIPFCIPRICEENRQDYVGELLNLEKESRGLKRKKGGGMVKINLQEEQDKKDGDRMVANGDAKGPTDGEVSKDNFCKIYLTADWGAFTAELFSPAFAGLALLGSLLKVQMIEKLRVAIIGIITCIGVFPPKCVETRERISFI